MVTWFTSDTHFSDHRVLNLYPRPFETVAAMEEGLIERWNAVVAPEDEVWHLGDFARTVASAERIAPRLHGHKHLILGNNDPRGVGPGWESVAAYAEIEREGVLLILCHYPFRTWNGQHRGSWNLHGHSHGRLSPLPRQWDVGVDPNNYVPLALADILAKGSTRKRSAAPA